MKLKPKSSLVVLAIGGGLILTGCDTHTENTTVYQEATDVKFNEGIGIKFVDVNSELSKEDMLEYYDNYVDVVRDMVEQLNLEVNVEDSNYCGYAEESEEGIQRINAYINDNSVGIYIAEKFENPDDIDIKGSFIESFLKKFIKGDINCDEINKELNYAALNDIYVEVEGNDIRFIETRPVIVDDLVIMFGVNEDYSGEIVMLVSKINANTSDKAYSYGSDNRGTLSLELDDFTKMKDELKEKYKELLVDYVGDESRIYVGEPLKLEDEPLIFAERENGIGVKSSADLKNELTTDLYFDDKGMDLNINYKVNPKKAFDIRSDELVLRLLELVFDDLDYENINESINKNINRIPIIRNFVDNEVEYKIYFPQGITLKIKYFGDSGHVKINVQLKAENDARRDEGIFSIS